MTSEIDKWTWPKKPEGSAEFSAMLVSLDQHLAEQGLPPHQRCLHATRLAAIALGSDNSIGWLPFVSARLGPADLWRRIDAWYATTYGDRSKGEFTPGSIVFRLRGSLWRLRMPVIYGSVPIVANRDLSVGAAPGGLPCNMLRWIVELTQENANTLTDIEIEQIDQSFRNGWPAISTLDALNGHDLFDQARDDYKHSVSALVEGTSPGTARWNIAQCAEKLLKGMLAKAGHAYPTDASSHNVPKLGSLVTKHLGVALPAAALNTVDCRPGVRYGEIKVSLSESFESHQALLELLRAL